MAKGPAVTLAAVGFALAAILISPSYAQDTGPVPHGGPKKSVSVNGFDVNYAPGERFAFDTLFKLPLCLAGAEYQNRFRIMNKRNHLVVIFVEMACKSLVLPVALSVIFTGMRSPAAGGLSISFEVS